jgi:signal transduction histidine kinase
MSKERDSWLAVAWSMGRYGSAAQFLVAILLTSILPIIAMFYVMGSSALDRELGRGELWALGSSVVVLVICGYVVLLRYPVDIVKLRTNLEALAGGNLPVNVSLSKNENDIEAIEHHMHDIVQQTETRIRTIQDQTQSLLAAERQRVMIESIGAACHHLGQPATVLTAYLEILNREATSEEAHRMLEQCHKASEAMAEILHRLQTVAEYRTEPYLTIRSGDAPPTTEHILRI